MGSCSLALYCRNRGWRMPNKVLGPREAQHFPSLPRDSVQVAPSCLCESTLHANTGPLHPRPNSETPSKQFLHRWALPQARAFG